MIKFSKTFIPTALLFVLSINVVSAQTVGTDVSTFIANLINFIDKILIPLVLAIAFIALVWGIVQYFVIGGSNDDAKAKGKSLIIYAVIGFVVILSFYGLVNILVSGIGLGVPSLQGTEIPNVPVTPTKS